MASGGGARTGAYAWTGGYRAGSRTGTGARFRYRGPRTGTPSGANACRRTRARATARTDPDAGKRTCS
ncbi:MAG: hypothetical protein M3N09_05635 [Actinomycetota bacterium]|nr:hypothetical protein [Actinomycetota bacterium]